MLLFHMLPKKGVPILFCLLTAFTFGQSSEQQALEAKKQRIQQQILEYNRLLKAEKTEKGNALEQVETLDRRINMNQELIRVSNQQANLLNRQINANIRKIGLLKSELEALKQDYAQMIQKSYQSKNQQNRVLFLLSSDGFWQAYKRLQYLQQYASYRKRQGEQIVEKTNNLTLLNTDLVAQRKVKERLLQENRQQKNLLTKEITAQKELLNSIRKNESRYTALIQERKEESRKIDREIDRLIRSEIASRNKASGSTKTNSFELTPEAKKLASNFSSNKGRLYWPVERGVISQGFGEYADKVYPGIKHRNSGIKIVTDKGSKARAIFDGEVMTVKTNKMGRKVVLVRHGNYIAAYYNLASTRVHVGDKVDAKTELGEVFTNPTNGRTELKFLLFQNTNKLNPEDWIAPNVGR